VTARSWQARRVKKAFDNERKHTQRIEKERDEEHEKVSYKY
jgi:hypothetical protein